MQFKLTNKRGSRHAAHAAKALRWRVDQLLKALKRKKLSPRNGVMVYFMSRSALGILFVVYTDFEISCTISGGERVFFSPN